MTYPVRKLSDHAFAVTDQNGKQLCVCDREEDAERIAYSLTLAADYEADAYADRSEWKGRS